MLPKIEELLTQIVTTKYSDVKRGCIFDLMDYQDIDITNQDIKEYVLILDKQKIELFELMRRLDGYKYLSEIEKEHR